MSSPQAVGLPPRPFLYTVDQLSTILSLTENQIHNVYLYHRGRDVGVKNRHQMEAINIAPPDERPDWRVAEQELVRWMRLKGFKFYDRGTRTRG